MEPSTSAVPASVPASPPVPFDDTILPAKENPVPTGPEQLGFQLQASKGLSAATQGGSVKVSRGGTLTVSKFRMNPPAAPGADGYVVITQPPKQINFANAQAGTPEARLWAGVCALVQQYEKETSI